MNQGYFDYGKNSDTQFEPYAGIKLAQVLGFLVFICSHMSLTSDVDVDGDEEGGAESTDFAMSWSTDFSWQDIPSLPSDVSVPLTVT